MTAPSHHRLPLDAFDQLARGEGDVATVSLLREAQLSRRILLLRTLVECAEQAAADEFRRADVAASMRTIAAARAASRRAIDALLLTPDVGMWTADAIHFLLRESRSDRTADDVLGFPGSVAVAAALSAGLDAEVTVRLSAGSFMIPTFGLVTVDASSRWLRIRVSGATRTLTFDERSVAVATGGDGPGFLSLRRLSAASNEVDVEVTLDDLSSTRTLLTLPLAPRLTAGEVEVWQERFDQGWRELADLDPARARSVAAGLTTVFPLLATEWAPEVSASMTDAFGAVGVTLPRDGTSCAVALVHEFQHEKLSALLDLVPIFREPGNGLYYAPWRADPRPIPGLLQGAYAFLGLVGLWDRRRFRRDNDLHAHFEFARWRDAVWLVLGTLRRHSVPTSLGERFLDTMITVVDGYRAAAVPPTAARAALSIAAESWASWQLRNCAPDDGAVEAWADAWSADTRPPRDSSLRCYAHPGQRGDPRSRRMALTQLRLRDPIEFRVRIDGEADLAPPTADRLYVAGAFEPAARHYKQILTREPTNIDAWTGLVMSRSEEGSTSLLCREPAAVRAVWLRVLAVHGLVADPDDLAEWMS